MIMLSHMEKSQAYGGTKTGSNQLSGKSLGPGRWCSCRDVIQPSLSPAFSSCPNSGCPPHSFGPTTLCPYDDMIFILMTHTWDYHHPLTIMVICYIFLTPLWEVGGSLLFGPVCFSLPFIFGLGDVPRRTRLPLKILAYFCLLDLLSCEPLTFVFGQQLWLQLIWPSLLV